MPLVETPTGRFYDSSITHQTGIHLPTQPVCINCIHAIMRERQIAQRPAALEMGIAQSSLCNYLNEKPAGRDVNLAVITWFKHQVSLRELNNVAPRPPTTAPAPKPAYRPPAPKPQPPPTKVVASPTIAPAPVVVKKGPNLTRDEKRQRIRAQMALQQPWKEVRNDKPGYVYVFKDHNPSRVKIGITDQPDRRIGALGCGNPDGVFEMILRMERPLYLETVCHRILEGAGLSYEGGDGLAGDNRASEWFWLNKNDAMHLLIVLKSKIEAPLDERILW